MKLHSLLTLGGLGLIALTTLINPTATNAQPGVWTQTFRTNYNVPRGDAYTGRSPYMQGGPAAAPAPAPAARTVTPEPIVPCSEAHHALVTLKKRMPAMEYLGREVMAEIEAKTVACAANIVITDWLPDGAAYVRSEPAGTVDGNKVTWRVPRADAGATMMFKIWMKPDKEGTYVNCASVSADPMVCVPVVIGSAKLVIDKAGPAEARINEPVPFTIMVKNVGSATARDVVVTDQIPDGLVSPSGQKTLTFNVGDLAPGASKTIPVGLTTTDKRGNLCNKAVAVASNAAQVEDTACVDVVKHFIDITKTTTDKELIIGRTATYTINIKNNGDRKQTGVVLTDTAAPGTTIVEAQGATIAGSVATWNVGDLDAGASKSYTVKIKSAQPGSFCNTARVTSVQGANNNAQACTEWIGVSGMLVELVDDPDPIQVGDSVVYTLRITNQGSTRAIMSMNAKMTFPEGITPLSASGGGTISAGVVTFPTVPTIAPKASVTYTINAKAAKTGDNRVRASVTSSTRQTPVEEDESTTVF